MAIGARTLAAAALVLFVSSEAAAADAKADTAGRAHFTKGVKLYKRGDYAGALVEFDAAYEKAGSFRVQYNIGQSCAALKQYACAVKAFEKFLADGGRKVPAKQRKVAESELSKIKARVSYVYVKSNTDGAAVTVDDAPAGTTPLVEPIMVAAGRHTFGASKKEMLPAKQQVEVPAGVERFDVALDLTDAPEAPPPSEPAAPPRPPPRPARAEGSSLPVWLGVGATGALAATTATLGFLTLGAKSDLEARSNLFGVTRDDLAAGQSYQNGLALGTDVALGATILAAGITVVLLLTR